MNMRISTRRLAQAVVLTIALSLTLVLAMGVWKGKESKDQLASTSTTTPDAEMQLRDMDYTEMQDGRRLWTLKASEARYFQDEQKTLLSSVVLTFFLEDGSEIHLESRQGTLYAGTKNIELWDSVHAEMPNGYELFTERAFYEHKLKKIVSRTVISVVGPDLEMEGQRWEYRIPEHMAVIEGGVNAMLRLPSPRTVSKSVRR